MSPPLPPNIFDFTEGREELLHAPLPTEKK